jgi:hypothetical protein
MANKLLRARLQKESELRYHAATEITCLISPQEGATLFRPAIPVKNDKGKQSSLLSIQSSSYTAASQQVTVNC